ncbi:MAG TPA: pre-peptidase C-terminal domain-containing protein, partial [Candidatus Thermoplasmatota archaeon]
MSKTLPLMVGTASAIVLLLCLVAGSASADGNNNSTTAEPVIEGMNGPFDINPVGDHDWYVFTITETARVRVELNGSSGYTRLYLYDANVSQIAYDTSSGTGGFSRIYRTVQPGTYYAAVQEYYGAYTLIEYYLTLEVDRAFALANGLNGPFDLSPVGDVDLFTFTVAEPSITHIELGGPSGYTRMYLYDVNLTQVDYDYSSGVGGFSRIVRMLQPGTYFAAVQEYYGSYTIAEYYATLDVDPGFPLAEGLNGPWDIAPPTDLDVFRFDVLEPSYVRVELNGSSGSTLMYLYNASGTQITYDYSGGVGAFSRITRNLYPGSYLATVQERYGTSNITGYHVTLERVSLLGPDGNGLRENATPVGVGANGPYDIDPAGDLDWYVVTFGSAGVAVIQTNGVAGDTLMTLYSASGAYLTQDLDSGTGSFSLIHANVSASTYYILVQGRTSTYTIYNYTLEIEVRAVPGPDGNDRAADAMPVGTGVFEPLSLVTGDVDWYMFTAATPGTLTVEANGPFGGAFVTLFEDDGTTTVSSGSYTGNNSFQRVSTIVDAGTYLIRVQLPGSGYSAVLDYNLTITFVEWVSVDGNDFRSTAVPISQGLSGPFSIDPAADLDWYWFQQAEAGNALVQIFGGSGQASITLLNETGYQLTGGAYGAQQVSSNLQPGVYYVRLQSAYSSYVVGTYYLNLTLPDSVPPALSITGPADQVQVETGAATITGATEAGARVWVSGEEVHVESDGTFSAVVLVPIGTNVYTVVVRDSVMNEAQANLTIVGIDRQTSLTNQLNQANQDLAATRQALDASRAAEATTGEELAQANAQLSQQ